MAAAALCEKCKLLPADVQHTQTNELRCRGCVLIGSRRQPTVRTRQEYELQNRVVEAFFSPAVGELDTQVPEARRSAMAALGTELGFSVAMYNSFAGEFVREMRELMDRVTVDVDVRAVAVNQRAFTEAVLDMVRLAAGGTSPRVIAVLVAEALDTLGITGKEVAAVAFGPYNEAAEGAPKHIAALTVVASDDAASSVAAADIGISLPKFSRRTKSVSFSSKGDALASALVAQLVQAMMEDRVPLLDAAARQAALSKRAAVIADATSKYSERFKVEALEFFRYVSEGFTRTPVPRGGAKLMQREMFEGRVAGYNASAYTIGQQFFGEAAVTYSRLGERVSFAAAKTPKQLKFRDEWRVRVRKVYVRMIKLLLKAQGYSAVAEVAVREFLTRIFYDTIALLSNNVVAEDARNLF